MFLGGNSAPLCLDEVEAISIHVIDPVVSDNRLRQQCRTLPSLDVTRWGDGLGLVTRY
jgi:hypothetical protein